MDYNKYWLNKSGDEYAWQQAQRSAHGNKVYNQQEEWLVDHLRRIANTKKRKLRVLDFGCGFGRFARILSKHDFVDYFGYDFSASMVEPLLINPPKKIADRLTERIRVKPTLREAYPTERFDVVFTVSVLIHNPAELAQRLLGDMLRLLEQEGQVCLVENKLCSMTVKDNDWHDGSWLHNFAAYLPAFHQVTVVRQVSDDHDVYLIEPCKSEDALFFIREDSDASSVPYDRFAYFRLGEERLALSIRNNESRTKEETIGGRGHDLEEKLGYALEDLKRQQEKNNAQQVENRILRDRISLTDSVRHWVREIEVMPALTICPANRKSSVTLEPSDKYLWNAEQDCRFAQGYFDFDRVCHVFHLEWFGIRAAAGSLPGSKLGISASANWSAGELLAISERLSSSNVRAVVIHGMSEAMRQLVEVLKCSGGVDLYLVWHGSLAQWIGRDEVDLASMAFELNRQGVFRRTHAIRSGMEMLFGGNAFVPQLLNMPPRVPVALPTGRKRESVSVLCPSWLNPWKNLSSNLVAAMLSDRVGKVFAFAENLVLPPGLMNKLQILPHRDQAGTIDLMAMVDLVSNVSVVDCHPMVNLEALAVGTPTLEGPLFLDALEEHPYKKLVRVDNPLSLRDIREAIESVVAVPEMELSQMMEDYRLQLTELSRQRYLDFLGASL